MCEAIAGSPGERIVLFDGTASSFADWRTVGGGEFHLVDGLLVTMPGQDLGLCYYAPLAFDDLVLRLEFRLGRVDDNSGVWVRFRAPFVPVPDRHDPSRVHAYDNPAFVAVDTGFEVQIDELARGNPQKGTSDGADRHRTGAIYGIPLGSNVGQQQYARALALHADAWNEYVIEVRGDTYRVELNGHVTASFTNTDAFRARSAAHDPQSGYLGLQSHTGHVAFRNITVTTLAGR